MGGLWRGHSMTITTRQGTTVKVTRATPQQMADILSGTRTPEQIVRGDAGTRPVLSGPWGAKARCRSFVRGFASTW